MLGIKCCHNCEKRHYKCHADCKCYISEKENYEKAKQIIAYDKQTDHMRLRVVYTIGKQIARAKHRYD